MGNYENDKLSGEKHLLETIFSKMESGVVFDIGANVGSYSKFIREINKNVKIYAFEPHPKTYKELNANVTGLNIKTYNYGAGHCNEEILLHDYETNDGSSHASVYKESIEQLRGKKSVSHIVKIIKLDDFFDENKINRINFIKIDTEGNEFKVLEGLKNSILQTKIDIIAFEFNEMNIFSRVFFKDFWDLLSNYNFYRLLPKQLMKIETYDPLRCEIFAFQNYIAIQKDIDIEEGILNGAK